jgi:hypothetical protein
MAAPTTPPVTAADFRFMGTVLAAAAIIAALVWHTMFPRYQIHVINDGHSVLIYDTWRDRIQRADYDDHGDPTLKRILKPF